MLRRALGRMPDGARAAARVGPSPSPRGSWREHWRAAASGTSPSSASHATMSFGVDGTKLDLMLNLEDMDFSKVVDATRSAMAEDARLRVSTGKEARSGAGHAPALSEGPEPVGRERRAVRGVVGAGRVQDAKPAHQNHVANQQARSEGRRLTLGDSLRDCAVSGNWRRAFALFEGALRRFPPVRAGEFESPAAPATAEALYDPARLEVLKRVVATAPPGSQEAISATMEGILRWNGTHFYLVLKSLVQAGRFEEAERVWSVMDGIGFIQLRMEERTAGALVSLLRPTTDSTAAIATSVVPNAERQQAMHEREMAFKQTVLAAVDQLVKQREWNLGARNMRTVSTARIAAALRHGGAEASGDSDAARASRPPPADSVTQPLSGVKVGDFNELLRRSTSEASTARVLSMMQKLGLDWDATTFASVMHSLRNPHYVHESGEEDAGESSAREGSAAPSSSGFSKEEHQKLSAQRLEKARQWFEACPVESRNADIYNEMLFLLRPRGHEDAFNTILTEFRGAPLLAAVAAPSADGAEASAFQTRLQWATAPNGRTFELLISRCWFLGNPKVCWNLYAEMLAIGVRGTEKLFHQLLMIAKQTPPPGKPSSAAVLELYDEMRRERLDVTSIRSTMTLVNAWSATRLRSRRF